MSGYPPNMETWLQVLLGHNRWATNALLNACESLDEASWHRSFDMGPGSLHDTFVHMAAAVYSWADRIHDHQEGARLSGRFSFGELQRHWNDACDALDATAAWVVSEDRLDERMLLRLGGQSYSFLRSTALIHVATHGIHHRAQALNMCRQLGLPPIGLDLDPVEYDYVRRGETLPGR